MGLIAGDWVSIAGRTYTGFLTTNYSNGVLTIKGVLALE
jgi:hypothetical protein